MLWEIREIPAVPDDRYDLEVSGPELCNMIHDYAKPLWQ